MTIVYQSKFLDACETGKDANSTSTAMAAVDVSHFKYIVFSVKGTAGTHATHVVELQCSMDGTTWSNSGEVITGEGMTQPILVICKYARLKVKTAEGATSTVTLCIQAKS